VCFVTLRYDLDFIVENGPNGPLFSCRLCTGPPRNLSQAFCHEHTAYHQRAIQEFQALSSSPPTSELDHPLSSSPIHDPSSTSSSSHSQHLFPPSPPRNCTSPSLFDDDQHFDFTMGIANDPLYDHTTPMSTPKAFCETNSEDECESRLSALR